MNVAKYLSEAQLRLMPRWEPSTPFADLHAMQAVIPLGEAFWESVTTTLRKPRDGTGSRAALCMRRLPFKVIRHLAGLHPVVTFDDGAQWLRATAELRDGFELDLMRSACWMMACRVVRGSRQRTALAKRAFKQYVTQWPDDDRIRRQPRAEDLLASMPSA